MFFHLNNHWYQHTQTTPSITTLFLLLTKELEGCKYTFLHHFFYLCSLFHSSLFIGMWHSESADPTPQANCIQFPAISLHWVHKTGLIVQSCAVNARYSIHCYQVPTHFIEVRSSMSNTCMWQIRFKLVNNFKIRTWFVHIISFKEKLRGQCQTKINATNFIMQPRV